MWEHGYLQWVIDDVDDMTEDAWIFKRFDGSAVGPNEEFRGLSLNLIMYELGQNGWEMISWHRGDSYWEQEFYFKKKPADN